MRLRSKRVWFGCVVSALLGAACSQVPGPGTGGGSGGNGGGTAGGTAAGGGMSAGGGGTGGGGMIGTGQSVTRAVGPTGGTLQVGCHTLTIPAGALSTELDITLTETTSAVPSGYESYSPLVRISPSSVTLAQPATLSLCFMGDAQLATIYLSEPDGGTFERLSSLGVTNDTIASHLTRFGDAFVANGVSYVEPADRSCVKLIPLSQRLGNAGVSVTLPDGGVRDLSSAVTFVFRAEDCQSRPVVGLIESDFVVKEDDVALSVEAAKTILPATGLQSFVTLVLDMSTSTLPRLPLLIQSATTFVNQLQSSGLRVPIAIRLFAGDQTSTEWQAPTLDTVRLRNRLQEIQSQYQPQDPSSTNLYGAMLDALPRSQQVQQDFRSRNAEGVFTRGYVVLFTDGADTAARRTLTEASMAARASPDVVFAVALDTGDFTQTARQALNQITSPDGSATDGRMVTVITEGRLDAAFGAIANRIAGLARSSYMFGYCSPKRSGTHTVALSLATGTSQGITANFNADTFEAGCAKPVLDAVCHDKECGGLACGACDDRTSACNGSTLKCDSFCKGPPARCGGATFTNPQGYEQTCIDSQQSTLCSSACVDLTTSRTNCGSCGNDCGSNGTCSNGSCQCNAGYSLCNGTCVALTTTSNCGTCGNACAAGASCTNGSCQCPAGQTACNGTCVSLTTTTNCGACGNACATGASCTGGSCQCPTGRTVCNGACVSLSTSTTNCGTCGNVCATSFATSSVCNAGSCQCGAGQAVCNGACTSLSTVTDCGACGNVCATSFATNSVCSGGTCQCPAGQGVCNGACTPLNTSSNCGACGSTCAAPGVCSSAICVQPCALPWGGSLAPGASVTAFTQSSVPFGSTCVSESRTCGPNGLSGSFPERTCSVAPPANCSVSGITLMHGQSRTFYRTSLSANCPAEAQSRTCNNGTLSGSSAYIYLSCSCSAIAGTACFNYHGPPPVGTCVANGQCQISVCGQSSQLQFPGCVSGATCALQYADLPDTYRPPNTSTNLGFTCSTQQGTYQCDARCR